MNKKILILASVIGLLGVIIGAFAAHGLKPRIAVESMQSFETGVRYQMYHALLLLFVGNTGLIPQKAKRIIFYLVLIGILFFSGSIYGLATTEVTGVSFKAIGFITPIGGLLLILSWIIMLINFVKIKNN